MNSVHICQSCYNFKHKWQHFYGAHCIFLVFLLNSHGVDNSCVGILRYTSRADSFVIVELV